MEDVGKKWMGSVGPFMYISCSYFKCDGEQLVTIFCIIAFYIFEDSFKHCSLYSKLNSACSYPSLTVLFFWKLVTDFLIWEIHKVVGLQQDFSTLVLLIFWVRKLFAMKIYTVCCSSVCGHCPHNASSTPWVMKIKNVSRHRQIPLGPKLPKLNMTIL